MKMFRKLSYLVLALAMMMVALAGCGKSNDNAAATNTAQTSQPAADNQPAAQPDAAQPDEAQATVDTPKESKNFKLGTISFGTETSKTRSWSVAQEIVAQAAGCELVRVELGGYDDEAFITAYESMIRQGADAVVIFTLSETVLPILKDMFEENNVKFFLANRKLSSKEMEDMMFGSPMCLGNESISETQNAYDMVKWLKENYDVKNMAAIGLAKGDINGDYRDKGIEQACNDLGINLLTTTRGIITTEDVTKSVDGLIASYPEMDSIFIVGGQVTQGALAGANQALVNHNMADKVKIIMVDTIPGMAEFMDDGPLKLAAGGNLISDWIFSEVSVANAMNDTPLSDMPVFTTNMFWMTTAEEATNFDIYIEGDITPFSIEEYQTQMFKWLNPDITFESVQKIISDFSIESVMERNKDKVK